MRNTLILLLGIALVGCNQSPGSQTADEESGHSPVFTIIGIDRTEGSPMTEEAIGIALGYVLAAQPCDQIQLRWISHQSFLRSEVIGELELPCLPPMAAAFDATASRRTREALEHIQLSRRAAVNALQRLIQDPPAETPQTDIVGFVAAASDTFRDRPTMGHQLVVISDFVDNASHSAEVDLQSSSVYLHVVGNQSNPGVIQTRIAAWANVLQEMGAASVRHRSELPAPYRPTELAAR